MREVDQSLFSRRTAIAVSALLIVFVGLLVLEGRPVMCATGFGFWSAAWTRCTSQNLFDPYSLSHVLHGVILYWLLWPSSGRVPLAWRVAAALVIEVGWEILENSPSVIAQYRQDTAAFDYTGDSILNALGDVASAAVGVAFAARYSWRASVALFLVFELTMLWLARDNLTLNVLMLLYPIEAIKSWQLTGLP